jgi:hypothetical protein
MLRILKVTSVSLISLIFVSIFLLKIIPNSDPPLSEHLPTEYDQIIKEKSIWRKILQKTNSSVFYEELKKAYQGNYNQHAIGHIFGDLLYEKEGVEGIETCDDAFYWGCYHAVTASAIADKGLPAIYDLDQVCKRKSSTISICNHGIGHGLSDYFGPSQLLLALQFCDKILGGDSCFTGVFMQHNFPLSPSQDSTQTEVRSLVLGQEFSPCDEFADIYEKSCYFELPRWWNRVLSSDFQKMGYYCSVVKDIKSQESCFSGIGDAVSLLSDPGIEKSLSICKSLPTYFGRNTCLVHTSLGFASDIYNEDKARPVCEAADLEYRSQCLKK